MKLQLDTEKKTISLQESVNLNELFTLLRIIFPSEEWKEYTLEHKQVISISPYSPFYPIENPFSPVLPWQPNYPWITYKTSDNPTPAYCITSGIFNVEIK